MKYDFEIRCKIFATNIRKYIKKLRLSIIVNDDCRQLIRSSGSIGANYIEGNQNLGTKDCKMHLKIAKKEAHESSYWLSILNEVLEDEALIKLHQEAKELEYILISMLTKLD